MFHESGVGCSTPHFAISLPGSHLAVVDRQASAAPAGTSGTEATPPLLPLVRHAVGGACSRPCSIPCTPPLGVASVQFIPAGRLRTKLRTQTPNWRETRRRKTPGNGAFRSSSLAGFAAPLWVSSSGPFPCPATIQCSPWCSITPPISTPGWAADTTPPPLPQSWSAG